MTFISNFSGGSSGRAKQKMPTLSLVDATAASRHLLRSKPDDWSQHHIQRPKARGRQALHLQDSVVVPDATAGMPFRKTRKYAD
jgi:hypothetical protein